MKSLNIILVDDNEVFRTALRVFIEQQLNHIVIADVASGEEFLELNSKFLVSADIILMDIMMKQISGIEATQKITWKYFNLKIIAVTMHEENIYLSQIIEAGFKGCVFKSNIFNDLEKALHEVYSGRFFMNENILIEEKS